MQTLNAGVKEYRVLKIERPSAHITLCKMVRYTPLIFVKVMLYSVYVYGKGTFNVFVPVHQDSYQRETV